MSARGSSRGQATLELALGALVFISVLFFGIYFGELTYARLKVQEVTTSAIWDTAGLRSHCFWNETPRFWSPTTIPDRRGPQVEEDGCHVRAGAVPEQRAEARYQALEGRRLHRAEEFTQVVVKSLSVDAQCTDRRLAVMPSRGPLRRLRELYPYGGGPGAERDGMTCNSAGVIAAVGMPRSFLEGDRGYFKQAQTTDAMLRLTVCGFGRPSGGRCRGGLTAAYGEFGLMGGLEATNYGWKTRRNTSYRNMVWKLYREYGTNPGSETQFYGDQASQLADWASGGNGSPVNESGTPENPWFVYRGEYSRDGIDPDANGDPIYNKPFHQDPTSEGGTKRWSDETRFPESPWLGGTYSRVYYCERQACFLGMACTPEEQRSWEAPPTARSGRRTGEPEAAGLPLFTDFGAPGVT